MYLTLDNPIDTMTEDELEQESRRLSRRAGREAAMPLTPGQAARLFLINQRLDTMRALRVGPISDRIARA